MRNLVIAIFATSIGATFWFAGTYPKAFTYLDAAYTVVVGSFEELGGNVAAVLLHKPVTVADLKNKYNAPVPKNIRILIIPGHEPDYGGTEYGDLKEREMNVELAQNLGGFLKNNGRYDVMLARDNKQWNPTLLAYFNTQWDEIITFFKDNKQEMLHSVNTTGALSPASTKPKVAHNAARTDVALRLYGINKWENENAVDIAIHVHFNDVGNRQKNSPGAYTGFAVYIPEPQYANSPTTRAIAETVFKRLSKYNGVSNLPNEDAGIVEESDLIAIGAHNTTNSPSMLIEYGYIYEPQFQNAEVRETTLRDLAFQTYLGLQDFFGSGNDVSFAYDTLMLPHSWKNEVSASKASPRDALALQSALLLDGEYPGRGKTKNDCPRSGRVGPCTLEALTNFQRKYGIKGEQGILGEETRELLNSKYSVKSI